MLDPPGDEHMATPRQGGLPIEGWFDTDHPTLGGRRLPLDAYELSRTLAISPAGDRFVLGAELVAVGVQVPTASRSGPGRFPRQYGRSTWPETAGWWLSPTTTERYAGTG